ncbi:MAG: tyrosine-type recombinase/integrase [Caldilineaceae bacterium]|nr:tyrosine-type recombinase/integrase [Caldilineaceae bacterium]
MESDTLAFQVDRFLDVKHNQATRAWYLKYLAPMVMFFGRHRALSSISRMDAEAYWQGVRSRRTCWERHPHKPTEQRSLAPTTVNNHLRAARSFWKEMVRQRYLDYNPFDHLKMIRDSRPVEMKAITPEDLRAIWGAAKQSSTRDVAIITVMATAGLRAGELISMQLSRLDLRKGLAWVEGKRGWRKIFLGQASVQAIRMYLQERAVTGTDTLWLNAYNEPLSTDGVRQMVDRLAERANVSGRHNLHAFRHRVAQAWLDSGINANIVAQALGHADVTVTLHIYGNQDERRVAGAIRQAEMAPFEEPLGLADLESN